MGRRQNFREANMTERPPPPSHRAPLQHAAAYRVPQVCAMLGISRATLYRRVKTGEIAIHKLGSISFVKREGLEALLETLPSALSISLPIAKPEIERDRQKPVETTR